MGDRVIYDAALPRNAKVAAIIIDISWQWPVANSMDLLALKEETCSIQPSGLQDSIVWLPSSSGDFFVSSTWNHIKRPKIPVPWSHLVWFPGNLPKAALFFG